MIICVVYPEGTGGPVPTVETPDASPLSRCASRTPGVGNQERASCSQRRRLASSVGAQQGGDLAPVEVQAEPAQGWPRVARKALLQAPYGDPQNQVR